MAIDQTLFRISHNLLRIIVVLNVAYLILEFVSPREYQALIGEHWLFEEVVLYWILLSAIILPVYAMLEKYLMPNVQTEAKAIRVDIWFAFSWLLIVLVLLAYAIVPLWI
jgi:hypothetical protein